MTISVTEPVPDNRCQTPSYIVKTPTELDYYDAAEYLGIHHRLLRRARAHKKISAVVYGYRTVRFSIQELERFKRRHLTAAVV